ncbi:hypothetical protein [Acidovorax cavernicola]|uniref:Terminase small subunit n=1 Tax=Acidovorax cavernicola TaxID=1675792 RepID=A0A9X8GUV8_9BURK|nr:hypothetical protein [Acidovorax cavernicola]RIX79132.1 hypothetical protein D3H34_15440 [Acidovorax cavernicola]
MKTGSLSEYAAHAGVSPAYVTKLKQAGRVVMVKVDGRDRVNFEMTDRLVVNTTDMSRARNGANAKPAPPAVPPSSDEPTPSGAASMVGGGVSGGNGGADMVFRKAQAQERVFAAKTAELTYRQKAGELVEKKTVERTVFDAFRSLRDQAFQAPQNAAARTIGMGDAREIERVIAEELRKAFDTWEKKMAERLAMVKGSAS